jgi:uncharacterized damage-inducible protein DinB
MPPPLPATTVAHKEKHPMTETELLTWVRAVLTTTPERWLNLTSTLPAELLERPPAAGEWSTVGCLHHLIDTERLVFPVRVQCLLAGRDFPPFSPHRAEEQAEPSPSPQALAQSFAALRREGLATLAQVTSANLEREGRHPDFGRVTLRQLLSTWAGHDLMHTVQAERALMQPFIAGVGPWQRYFSDHWAG